MLDQVTAHKTAKAEMGEDGRHLTLSLSRVAFICKSAADRQAKIVQANDYYSRFDNVFTGPGIVEGGMIVPLPRKQTIGELADSLLIFTPAEMVDKLGPYAEAGVDYRECVSCGFKDEMRLSSVPREVETRVNISRDDIASQTQPVKLMDPKG